MEQLDISRNEKLSKIKKDPLKIIPKKVITYSIAKYLYRSDLLSCSLVSSSWKTVFSDNVLWKKCFFSFFEYTEIEGVDKKYEEMFSLLFSVPNYWKKMYFFFVFFVFILFFIFTMNRFGKMNRLIYIEDNYFRDFDLQSLQFIEKESDKEDLTMVSLLFNIINSDRKIFCFFFFDYYFFFPQNQK